MKKIVFIAFILFVGTAFFSCKKKSSEPTPGPPEVKYMDFNVVKETEAYFHFGFTDPDGDIGLKNSDTDGVFKYPSIYNSDFHMRLQIYSTLINNWKDTAVYNPSTSKKDTLEFLYRIPYVDPQSKDKSLTGEVYVEMTGYRFLTSIKRFRYQFYIYDRSQHKSNVVTTPEFNYP
jgi:hypothetical protein